MNKENSMKDANMNKPWEYCDSLRYGFDDNYDPLVFEDDDKQETAMPDDYDYREEE
tara:strand:- start:141 stop:308 length:168 start_codon:yes stop_codon:yes gene_type:complete